MRTITAILVVVFCLYASLTYASGSYKKYNLPYGISVELPKDWDIYSKQRLKQLNNAIEAKSGISQANTEILIGAQCFIDSKYPSATFSIDYTNKKIPITQDYLSNISNKVLLDLNKQDRKLRSKFNSVQKETTYDISTSKTKRTIISSKYSIHYSCDLYSYGKERIENSYLIPLKNSYIKINCVYEKDNGSILKAIFENVISSIQIK